MSGAFSARTRWWRRIDAECLHVEKSADLWRASRVLDWESYHTLFNLLKILCWSINRNREKKKNSLQTRAADFTLEILKCVHALETRKNLPTWVVVRLQGRELEKLDLLTHKYWKKATLYAIRHTVMNNWRPECTQRLHNLTQTLSRKATAGSRIKWRKI